MNAVTREIAQAEVEKWLDFKKVSTAKRESYKENVETLVTAIMEGVLVLNESTFEWEQTLKFPTSGEAPITKLCYKPRLKIAAIHAQLQNVKTSDADGRICAYISALTGQIKPVIKDLDTEDYATGQSISIFFL